MAAGREGQRTAINENDIYGAKLDVARAKCQRATIQNKYRPRSIYQYSNMDRTLSGQTSIFRASSYEPGNRAGSVTGTNSVVCSYEKFQPGRPG